MDGSEAVPEVRSIYSPDVDLESFGSLTGAEIMFLVEIEIGEQGVDGADLFSVLVASPEALVSPGGSGLWVDRERGWIVDRATILVDQCTPSSLRSILGEVISSCHGRTWTESVAKLQRYFRWEYEDYKVENE